MDSWTKRKKQHVSVMLRPDEQPAASSSNSNTINRTDSVFICLLAAIKGMCDWIHMNLSVCIMNEMEKSNNNSNRREFREKEKNEMKRSTSPMKWIRITRHSIVIFSEFFMHSHIYACTHSHTRCLYNLIYNALVFECAVCTMLEPYEAKFFLKLSMVYSST